MKKLSIITLLFLSIGLSAQDTKDTASAPLFRYSVSLQVGQANRLVGAEIIPEEGYYNINHGEVHRYSLGYGFSFRYYTDETFFLHLRCMYSARKYDSYDSSFTTAYDDPFANGTDHHIMSYAEYNYFCTKNFLIGIGGGHEQRFGNFMVRAGGEIDFIKYTQMLTYNVNATIDDLTADTTAGGTYTSHYSRGYVDKTIHPKPWGIGITGHATLEYFVKPNFGIGATLYMGGFYVGAKDAEWIQESGTHDVFNDSSGQNYDDADLTTTERTYNLSQFDFSPLNGQINVVYYFGK